MTQRLGRSFFNRPADELARVLLGTLIVRALPDGLASGVIVETEAYLGPQDKAAHTFAGRKTDRVRSMWQQPGTLYVYFTYGMHHCMNVVSGPEHSGCAVLIRALEPHQGVDLLRARRPAIDSLHGLCSGPAKTCQALAIDRALDGVDLTLSPDVWLAKPPAPVARRCRALTVRTGPRVGVHYAQEWADKPLRYALSGHPCVSRPAL